MFVMDSGLSDGEDLSTMLALPCLLSEMCRSEYRFKTKGIQAIGVESTAYVRRDNSYATLVLAS